MSILNFLGRIFETICFSTHCADRVPGMGILNGILTVVCLMVVLFLVIRGIVRFFGPVTWKDGEGNMPEGRGRSTWFSSFKFWS